MPGIVWLVLLFLVPFYVVLSIAAGRLNLIFESVVPVWNPLHWTGPTSPPSSVTSSAMVRSSCRTFYARSPTSRLRRLCRSRSRYPTAYFVTRFAGRRKGLFLALLIAPFWVSYMMRMLAWVDLLQLNGYVNKASDIPAPRGPACRLAWRDVRHRDPRPRLRLHPVPDTRAVRRTRPDRPPPLEAGRDLGLNRWRTFIRVTLPLSRQSVITGMLITALPMFGDYFTNQMLSGTPGTAMVGNLVQGQLQTPGEVGQGAALSALLLAILVVPMLWYVISTARASREAY